MQLKELKKEIDGLTSINKTLIRFKNSWLKKIKSNSNPQFPFLQKLDQKTKKEINSKLSSYQELFPQLKYFQFTQEKLASLAHYLIELKLTSLNGDRIKPRILLDKFLDDDFLNLKLLIDEAAQFEFNLNCLKQIYHQTNHFLLQKLPLEHSVAFMDSPHKEHLNRLFLISQKQKKLLKVLGKEFVCLTKEMKKKGRL